MRTRTHISIVGAAFALVCLAAPAFSATSLQLTGSLGGLVTDGAGVPQMGAAVMLFDRQDHLFEKVMTDERGIFGFAGLLPDIYSVRITLASFVPAIKNSILIQPGMRSVLNVSMATLFSSIQLVYPSERPAFMSDDWKWALRTASSTRPVMRFLPNLPGDENRTHHHVFSDTRGLLMFSAGDGSLASGFGSSADMGTAFAVGTSLWGENQIQFAGNVGTGAQSGIPTAAFRTSYHRGDDPNSPEFSVTMHELFLPNRMGLAIFGAESSLPALRSMSSDYIAGLQITRALSVQYGAGMDSISFLDHVTYLSPFVRAIYNLGHDSEIEFNYAGGSARPEMATSSGPDNQLQTDLGALSMFPLVSLRAGRAEAQRGRDLEIEYSRQVGSRKFSASVYHQSDSNMALTVASPDGFLPVGDILPDFFSGTAIFDAGSFATTGYLASVTQNVGDQVSATVTYGSLGALTTPRGEVVSNDPDELRSMIHTGRLQSLTGRIEATSRHTGTHVIASYQLADNRYVMPAAFYSTRGLRPEPGFNIYIRQPLPQLSVLPWRMELTAELRNLLQQGYLPISTADGGRVVLMEVPRMFRGGVSFIF